MSKLNVDQKTIKDLFQDKRADFLIPDYQRPYAWSETECRTLWDDIFSFAIPDEGRTEFDSNSEYFLGPIVTFKNDDAKMEVIDGQQRLTTLMLLLRAFYEGFKFMQDKASVATRQNIERCIWKTDEFGEPNISALKIDSEVATDNDKDEFIEILRSGIALPDQKSKYAVNYRFFQECVHTFSNKYPAYFAYLPTRIMNNCILLPIEAESQDTALRIFSTLNDRGMPLSDSDIFKAQFYKHYSKRGKKDEFIRQWKEIEELTARVFHPQHGTPMDELFTRYMYYIRAKMGIKTSTTEALRKFYERDGYALLKDEKTFEELIVLAHFWEDISNQDSDRFSQKILRKLFVLSYAPNSMWTYFVSVYFLHNKDSQNLLDEDFFDVFLNKITGFMLAYAVINPGVNALRTPVYAEMTNIVNDRPVSFAGFRFNREKMLNAFMSFNFSNVRPVTKSVLAWWAYQDSAQELLSLETAFEIEHIYARNRVNSENSLSDWQKVDALGNKILLEKRINIRASDYRFADKKKYYEGFTNSKGQVKEGTGVVELLDLTATSTDFTENDIIDRYKKMIDCFINYLQKNGLLK